MKKFVITIARENGSGGRAIGEALARHLGIEFYNRDLLRLASDESGISEQLFAKADEEVQRTLLCRVAHDAYKGEVIPPDSDDYGAPQPQRRGRPQRDCAGGQAPRQLLPHLYRHRLARRQPF